jgi:hypothetical protein
MTVQGEQEKPDSQRNHLDKDKLIAAWEQLIAAGETL